MLISMQKHSFCLQFETSANITKTRPCNIQRFLKLSKMKIFNRKILIFFLFLLKTDCRYTLDPPRRGSSNEYPQPMFWSKNKKNRYTPANPSFSYIKVGFKGVYIARTCFPDEGASSSSILELWKMFMCKKL